MLTTDNYFAWSNDLEVLLKKKDLWWFVDKPYLIHVDAPVSACFLNERKDISTATHAVESEAGGEKSGVYIQKRDVALAYTLASIDSSYIRLVRTLRWPAVAHNLLRMAFHAVTEASLNTKQSQPQVNTVDKWENIFSYSIIVMALVSGLESTVHSVREIKKKRTLLPGFTREFDLTSKVIIDEKHGIHEAVSIPIVRETRLQESDRNKEKTLLAQKCVNKCFTCEKSGHLAKYF